MTFFSGGGSAFGASRSAQFEGTASRSQILGRRYQPFANPFFDHASTYLPPTIKAMFGFCRYYHLTHGIINAIDTKAAEYPVTDLILQHKDTGVVKKWEELLLGVMNYRVHQFEVNLDYYVYGNAFVSPSFPFRKKLICVLCRSEHDAVMSRPHWRYTNHKFWLTCHKCGQTDFAKSRDDYYPKYAEISMIRWNPEHVHIFYNEATGRMDYGLDLSPDFRNQITMGRKDLVATTPEVFLEAVATKRSLVFDKQEVFHLRRPSLSTMNRGWGIPLIMPVLKDAFYMQVMKKAQEAVLLTHLVPQVFLFPQPATAGADPFCVSPDTLVETIDGLRQAAEVQEGDFLRSHTGAWKRVTGRIERSVEPSEKVYRITAKTLPGFPFTVSEDHPILAVKNTQKRGGRKFDPTSIPDPEFIKAQDLSVGDFVAYPVKRTTRSNLTIDVAALCPEFAVTDDWVYTRLDQQGAEIFEYLKSEGVPEFKSGPQAERLEFLKSKGWDLDRYVSVRSMLDSCPTRHPRHITLDKNWSKIIGYYLAEGSTSQATTSFTFHFEEPGFVDELVTALHGAGYTAVVDDRAEQSCRVVRVEGVILAHLVRELCGRYSSQKHIPAVVSEAPDELCFDVLRCVFNGDGTFLTADDKGTSRVCLKTTSPNLALETRRLLLSFGLIGGVSRAVPSASEIAKQPYYQVYYNGASGDALAKAFGWEGFKDPGKRAGQNSFIRGDYVYMRVAAIEEVEEPVVIGFQIQGDKTFCVAGVATHNTTINLADWRDHIRREIARQRMDPSYYGILPFPLGHQTIGENGRSLLLMPEIQQIGEQIAVGMGFPTDLVFGHGNYAGTSVSMRMLENFFLSNVHSQKRLLHWVMKRMGAFLNWPIPDGRFKPFRMADDLQRQAYMAQLSQQGKISDATLLSYADLKIEDEADLMANEVDLKSKATRAQQMLQANIQGEAQLVAVKYQAQAQGAMQKAVAAESTKPRDPFAQEQGSRLHQAGGYPLDAVAAALAKQVFSMPVARREAYLAQMRQESPELAQMVAQEGAMPQPPGQAAQQPQQLGVDMRPQPEALPPRR